MLELSLVAVFSAAAAAAHTADPDLLGPQEI